ncbi:MAG: ABC transporter ATP-binding protein [Dehalococcoidia bacterium]
MSITATLSTRPLSTSADATAIDIDTLSFSYGEQVALDTLSLRVAVGAVFGLLGPNGSGKSTLLSLLTERRRPQSGTIRLLGEPLTARLRARMGVVFQEPSLDPHMTVIETMRLQARLFALPGAAATRRTAQLLDTVGLADRGSALTATLSGGMKRRLELARALIADPELLLLDEPTLALDPESKQRLWAHLREANAAGLTLLVATNDVQEAERYCGTVALLSAGKLVAQGAPSELRHGLRREAVRIEWRDGAVPDDGLLEALPGAGQIRRAGQVAHVTVDAAAPFLARLFERAGERIHAVRIEESTLEDVYFQLVGRAISQPSPHEPPA